jgi:hypothetical protein
MTRSTEWLGIERPVVAGSAAKLIEPGVVMLRNWLDGLEEAPLSRMRGDSEPDAGEASFGSVTRS